MKLSIAIQLGSMVMQPVPGIQDDGHGNGCAIGMGLRAEGMKPSVDKYQGIENETLLAAYQAWPWLLKRTIIPCNEHCSCSGDETTFGRAITHLFDVHVCNAKDWTFAQLIAFIQSVEPAEPESDTADLDLVSLLTAATESHPA